MSTRGKIIDIIKKSDSIRAGELVARLGITPQALHRHLARLCQEGVLQKLGSPPKTRYQVTSNARVLSLEQHQVASEIKSILGAHPAVLLVTLFGSFARGEHGPESDIDVLIWLSPSEPFDRRDLWDYWDRHSRHLGWAKKLSMVTQRWRPRIAVNTLLLDMPEEHLKVFDRDHYFDRLRNAVSQWRIKNGSIRMASFGKKHGWKYSTKVTRLDEIDFNLEVGDVA